MTWLKRLLGRTNRRPYDLAHVVVRSGGFDVIVQAELPVANKVDWSDIKKIEAYRTDEAGPPTVALRISLFWGRRRLIIDHDVVGFNDLAAALAEAFPDISEEWRARIEAPFGFDPHETLYEAS